MISSSLKSLMSSLQGQELMFEADEKTLSDLGFKDHQVVFVSTSTPHQKHFHHHHHHGRETSSSTAFPGREGMPMNLLLLPIHFELLFLLMQRLSDMRAFKAQILSRRVWEIILLLPTSPHLKETLQNIQENHFAASGERLRQLLNPESPQKLLYTLYIVDWLGRPVRMRRRSGLASSSQSPPADPINWKTRYI